MSLKIILNFDANKIYTMKKLLLILFCLPMIGFGQSSSHIISGIDLNKDWYTLSNQSVSAYYMQEQFRKENNIPGVGVNFDENYLLKHADKDFLNIGFTELMLIFPQGNQSNLDKVEPKQFYALLKYKSESDYDALSEKAFTKIASILMEQFGPPNKTMKKSWGAMFEWNFDNAQIMLNTNKNDHITLTYLKQ